jgi:RNA polymerase sigma-70 factor, ECF subfamily
MDYLYSIELVERIFNGDAAAEQELFDLFADQIQYFVRRKIGFSNPDWQDIQQEIFISFFNRIREQQYDPQKGSLAAFLQTTIQYKVLDYYKNPVVKIAHDPIEQHQNTLMATDPRPDVAIENIQRRHIIQSAVATLPPKYKKILYLAVYKQIRIQEIAQMLGCSEQKVSNLKSYAITLLKRKLKTFEDSEENV